MSKTCMTKEIQPQQYTAKQLADRQPKQHPEAQGDPHGQHLERSPWGTEEESSPWSPGECPLCNQGRGRKAASTAVHHHTKWIGQLESKQRAV